MTTNDFHAESRPRCELFNGVPDHWRLDRLKWSISELTDGIWGEEPTGHNEILCIRVADFDRVRLKVIREPATVRSIAVRDIESRVLRKDNLLIEKSGGGEIQTVGCVVHFDRDFEAVCSNFIGRITVADGLYPRFWVYVHAYLYMSRSIVRSIKQTTGIQNLDIDHYLNQLVPYPPFEDQEAIAIYLDYQTERIDALIGAKLKLLELLAEKRKALITRAVTLGLSPEVPLRDSGIPWLGEIPVHWEVSRIAWLFRERDQRGEPDLPLLMVSINLGVVLREFSDERIESTASDFNMYKIARRGDVVFNKMRMWQGAVGVAPVDGLVSPDYVVAEPRGALMPGFAELLFRTQAFSAECAAHSYGIVWDRLRLYWDGFRDISVALPPVDEQATIVDYLSSQGNMISNLCDSTRGSIDLLRERRGAIIAAAVAGQIEVGRAV